MQCINDLWEIKVNNGRLIKSNNLILSSSLIAHPRFLNILKINSLPLRDAFMIYKDKVVDALIKELRNLTYHIRKVYIFHVSHLSLSQNFNNQYLQIIFPNVIKEDCNFERIIFQRQSDESITIGLHCSYLNNPPEINIDNICKSFRSLFANYEIFLELCLHANLIDIMDWRAS